eukprot:GHRR01009920.1.p1 GENE.GHRR01009920.1~~GHRR01009920.1.p1  ORF type:complete len:706 (+),score=318.40 GHRR01009920.1:678-2795(+)
MTPLLPNAPAHLRKNQAVCLLNSSGRAFSFSSFPVFDLSSSRGNSGQQQPCQQQQQQQSLQQLARGVPASAMPAMVAATVPAIAVDFAQPTTTAAAADRQLLSRSNSGSAALMNGLPSSRQGSINSSFYDADSMYEACCNSKESFLLPDDAEEGPIRTAAAQLTTPAAVMSSVPTAQWQCRTDGTGAFASTAAVAGTSTARSSTLWNSLTPSEAATARSPFVSGTVVASLLDDDSTPSLDLLQLDGQLAPDNNLFAGMEADTSTDQLLSLCGPAAPAGDVSCLFDSSQPLAGGATTAALNRQGLCSRSASMVAAAALRRGKHELGSSHFSDQSGECLQQHQLCSRLVVLDASIGMPLGSPAAALPAEQRSGTLDDSPLSSGAANAAGSTLASPVWVVQRPAAAAAGGGAATAITLEAQAAVDDAFSAVGGTITASNRGRGRARGRGRGAYGRKSFAAGRHSVLPLAIAGTALLAGSTADIAAATVSKPSTPVAASVIAAAAATVSAPAAGASVAAVSSDAQDCASGDSSSDSAETQQQQQGDSGKATAAADGEALAAEAAAAAPAAGKQGPRIFHHKGGGPCDHCGVVESPQWRRGPPAKPILCNACGTRYRRTHNLGPPIPSSGRPGSRQAGVVSNNSSSNAAGDNSNGGRRSQASSSSSTTVGHKRPAALQTPIPVNMNGGVHTGTRTASGRRPIPKMPKTYG